MCWASPTAVCLASPAATMADAAISATIGADAAISATVTAAGTNTGV